VQGLGSARIRGAGRNDEKEVECRYQMLPRVPSTEAEDDEKEVECREA
jgi:hypothetical protein